MLTFERLSARAWNQTKRPVLAAFLWVFRKRLGAQDLRFADETIDAGYATYRTLATVRVPVTSLFPVQVGRGPVPLITTPHFSFVQAHLKEESGSWEKESWRSYTNQASPSSPSTEAKRQQRFEILIDRIKEDPEEVHILVAINPRLRGFEIVDGFHRAAIMAVCHPHKKVLCSVVSHIVA